MPTLSTKKIVDLFVHEDIKSYGFDEDGSDVQLPVQYVVAELKDGTRYAHAKTFEQDAERAQALCNRIGRSDEIDLANWSQIDPAYGSAAYDALDSTGFFYDREKQEDQDRGQTVGRGF